jgi:S-adenosylmethionine:tRNA ribosyltransferase-isomerase
MHPKQLSIEDFSYDLPEHRIAPYPLAERDASKLLVYKNGSVTEDNYRNIDQYLPSNSLLLFNDTRVVPARILFQKPTGAVIELFCLEPHSQYADINTAMLQKQRVVWMCLIGGASKWKAGQQLEKKIQWNDQEVILYASFAGKEKDCFIIEFSWTPAQLSFAAVLQHAGLIPLPPYIKRAAESSDAERYQTIYAHTEGSVAAPTAGLHFTDAIFQKLANKNIQQAFVTLHVGAGTFKPVKSAIMEEHDMHTEYIDVTAATIQQILANLQHPITAVGTTSLRTIESLYWLGVKTIVHPSPNFNEVTIHQWDAYELNDHQISVAEALEALLQKMQQLQLTRLITKTALLIAPGYSFKIPTALVTNFHQPRSTLLLLVAAFAGKEWRKIYQYALENEFRFLSYGDGCLLFRE